MGLSKSSSLGSIKTTSATLKPKDGESFIYMAIIAIKYSRGLQAEAEILAF